MTTNTSHFSFVSNEQDFFILFSWLFSSLPPVALAGLRGWKHVVIIIAGLAACYSQTSHFISPHTEGGREGGRERGGGIGEPT